MSSINPKADAKIRVVGEYDPIGIADVHQAAPWWPYGIDGTYRLVRAGALRAIAIGRRRYVTLALLRECLSKHTTGATAA
jgi:hypothetical protein